MEGKPDPFAMFEGLQQPGAPSGPPIRDFPGKRPPKNRKALQRAVEPLPEDGERWDSRPKVRSIKGVDVELFTVGQFAQAMGRKPVTIRYWEANGTIPKARIRTTKPKGEQVPGKAVKGLRLYTRHQIESAMQAAHLAAIDTPSADWQKFTATVIQAWRNEKLG